MQSVALQIGLPGTQELVIVLFIGLFFLAIPVLLVAALVKFLTGNDSETDERIIADSNAKSNNSAKNAGRRRENLTTNWSNLYHWVSGSGEYGRYHLPVYHGVTRHRAVRPRRAPVYVATRLLDAIEDALAARGSVTERLVLQGGEGLVDHLAGLGDDVGPRLVVRCHPHEASDSHDTDVVDGLDPGSSSQTMTLHGNSAPICLSLASSARSAMLGLQAPRT